MEGVWVPRESLPCLLHRPSHHNRPFRDIISAHFNTTVLVPLKVRHLTLRLHLTLTFLQRYTLESQPTLTYSSHIRLPTASTTSHETVPMLGARFSPIGYNNSTTPPSLGIADFMFGVTFTKLEVPVSQTRPGVNESKSTLQFPDPYLPQL